MRIAHFSFKDKRSIKYAQCDKVPKLMIIAGPNGAGKSTLLYEMRNVGGRQDILYVGPHRASSRQYVQHRHLIGGTLLLSDLLTKDSTPGFDGVRVLGESNRDPWNGDGASNFIKHSLCQVEIERQQAIASRFDRTGEIQRGSVVDPWSPLRELVGNLLPHLKFVRIDNTDRNSVRCIFSVHSKEIEVDLDDLSSGEKSVIQMFYPLVEHRVRSLLKEISGSGTVTKRADTCVVIDEPEIHLHPNLQMKVLDYLRLLSASEQIQIIVATHSPTIVEAATFDELYLLRPVELVAKGENQLMQIASDEDKLRILRELFGTTSNVTAMQHVVVVEGTDQETATSTASDRKLYRALHKGFDGVTLVPGGGKAECLKLVNTLNGAFPSLLLIFEHMRCLIAILVEPRLTPALVCCL